MLQFTRPASILKGIDTLAQNEPYAIYDRIINLKVFRKDENGNETYFMIRSDYEMITDKGTYHFERVKNKPCISIKYTQYLNTAVEATVKVSNFHSYSLGTSSNESFSAGSNPITKIEAQMGYFGQMPDFTDSTKGYTIKDYHTLGSVTNKRIQGFPKTITFSVLGAYMSKTPPDSETTFRCIVGDVHEMKVAPKEVYVYYQEGKEEQITDREQRTPIVNIVQDLITKRFVNPALDIGNFEVPRDDKDKGYMDDAVAAKYGVKCYISKKLRELKLTTQLMDKNSYYVNKNIMMFSQETPIATLEYLAAQIPELRYIALADGSFLLMHAEEESTSVVLDLEGKEVAASGTKTLPAIYDITIDALKTIRCPFFSFIQPMQKVEFLSRYNLSKLVGYFVNPAENRSSFTPLKIEVEFATVEDKNMMVMTCT